MADQGYAGDVTPTEAWAILKEDPRARLIDVRTRAEWSFVGTPDLSGLGREVLLVEWQAFPAGTPNPDFVAEVAARIADREAPLFFLCRSGGRSRNAAKAMTAAGYRFCHNVATGFEGDHDAERHRGQVSGWKVEGLPWIQG